MTTTNRNTNDLTDPTAMSPKGNQQKQYGRPLRVTIAALMLVIVSALATTQGAFAWSYGTVLGASGNVISLSTIYVGDLFMPNGSTQFTLYGDTSPIVGRSSASTGDQIVAGQYFVEKFDGANWVKIAQSPLMTGQIRAGQTNIQFPAPYIQPLVARGYFRFTWQFSWSTSTGAPLGATEVVSNLKSDHVCVTKIRLCQVSAGYVQTGLNLGAW